MKKQTKHNIEVISALDLEEASKALTEKQFLKLIDTNISRHGLELQKVSGSIFDTDNADVLVITGKYKGLKATWDAVNKEIEALKPLNRIRTQNVYRSYTLVGEFAYEMSLITSKYISSHNKNYKLDLDPSGNYLVIAILSKGNKLIKQFKGGNTPFQKKLETDIAKKFPRDLQSGVDSLIIDLVDKVEVTEKEVVVHFKNKVSSVDVLSLIDWAREHDLTFQRKPKNSHKLHFTR